MLLKKIAAAKGAGRKQIAELDNVVGCLFMAVVFSLAVIEGYVVFGYFGMGVLVTRIGGIIFEVRRNLFDRPFFHYLLLIAIPGEIFYDLFLSK